MEKPFLLEQLLAPPQIEAAGRQFRYAGATAGRPPTRASSSISRAGARRISGFASDPHEHCAFSLFASFLRQKPCRILLSHFWCQPYGMASNRTELTTLKKLLSETELILSTRELPQNRTARCRELLRTALALTDDLLSQAKLPAAAILGRKGGSVTAKRGSAYFRKLAGRRKTHGGGRPRKEPE